MMGSARLLPGRRVQSRCRCIYFACSPSSQQCKDIPSSPHPSYLDFPSRPCKPFHIQRHGSTKQRYGNISSHSLYADGPIPSDFGTPPLIRPRIIRELFRRRYGLNPVATRLQVANTLEQETMLPPLITASPGSHRSLYVSVNCTAMSTVPTPPVV